MHTTLAVGTDGIPLGIPRIEYNAPDGKAEKGRPAEERKSARWLRGLRDASEMSSKLEGVRIVSVMDREGDFFALFAERERLGNVDILARAKSDRALGPNMPKLFGSLRSAPVRAHMEIHVVHASKRNSARGQTAMAKREARVAEVALRWVSFELAPPAKISEFNGAKPVRLSAVHALEETDPSDGSPKLEWILLTSLDVNSRRDVLRMLDWHRLRWRIEDWRRILKSGCKAENLNPQASERIERAVTIKAVIARRLAAMVLMGRETPELPAETLFSDIEIKALSDFASDRKLPQPGDLGRRGPPCGLPRGDRVRRVRRPAQPGPAQVGGRVLEREQTALHRALDHHLPQHPRRAGPRDPGRRHRQVGRAARLRARPGCHGRQGFARRLEADRGGAPDLSIIHT